MSEPIKSSEPKPEEANEPDIDDTDVQRPVGAILVTTFLALMILISWFGMYFLDFLRS